MRKDGAFIKVERLAQIRKEIASKFPEPVDIKMLQLWVECNVGLSEEKSKEYIEKAVASAGWSIIDGKIVSEIGAL